MKNIHKIKYAKTKFLPSCYLETRKYTLLSFLACSINDQRDHVLRDFLSFFFFFLRENSLSKNFTIHDDSSPINPRLLDKTGFLHLSIIVETIRGYLDRQNRKERRGTTIGWSSTN